MNVIDEGIDEYTVSFQLHRDGFRLNSSDPRHYRFATASQDSRYTAVPIAKVYFLDDPKRGGPRPTVEVGDVAEVTSNVSGLALSTERAFVRSLSGVRQGHK